MRWYHYLFLPLVLLVAALIGIFIAGHDRFSAWRYRNDD